MGFVDWLKGTFGKQTCAFCGTEVGMLKRTKIKDKEFICNDCARKCSQFIQLYRFTKDELMGHMEYMKQQGKLYELLEGKYTLVVPSATQKHSVEFYDDHGMFRIRDRDKDSNYARELIRYDQVAKWEPYILEDEPSEPGKEKVFKECGVKITLVGAKDDVSQLKQGVRSHPYITNTITVCLNKRDKHLGELEINQVITHFNVIFGVNDNQSALFSFGPSTQQKRDFAAMKAMGGMIGAAIQTAKNGGEVSEETAQQVKDAMDKVSDAATSGLAEYTRRADAAEDSIK